MDGCRERVLADTDEFERARRGGPIERLVEQGQGCTQPLARGSLLNYPPTSTCLAASLFASWILVINLKSRATFLSRARRRRLFR